MIRHCLQALFIGGLLGFSLPAPAAELFTSIKINDHRSEASAIADLNKDGKLDIIAGNFWYEAPTWVKHQFRTLGGGIDSAGNGFLNSDFDLPLDVDGDGFTDLVSGYIYEGLSWFRNPGIPDVQWARTQSDSGEHHSGDLWDIDGDGKALEIFSGKETTRWYEVGALQSGKRGLIRHDVASTLHQYGFGVGDLNGDRRPDLIRPTGWFEAPANPRTGIWKEHCLALGYLDTGDPAVPNVVFPQDGGCGKTEHTQQIWVSDVDMDGLNDIITGGAHTYGLFWYKQIKGYDGVLSFERHIIDQSWSQVHAINMADFDNDGDLDIVTGKRWRAHGLDDPGGKEPAGVYWYELQRTPAVKWVKHTLSFDAGISAGMNVAVADMDADGDLDFVVTSKAGGPYLFVNHLEQQVSLLKRPLDKTGKFWGDRDIFIRPYGSEWEVRNALGRWLPGLLPAGP